MHKLTVILLSVLFLGASFMPGSQIQELLKVPFIFEHFEMHKETVNKNTTFKEFLVLHYSKSYHNINTSEHENLPFHGSLTQNSLQDHLYVFVGLQFLNANATLISLQPHYGQFVHSSEYVLGILHPPIA